MKNQYIEDLQDNTEINSTFAVTSKSSPGNYKNKTGLWFSIEITDKTGKMDIKYWGGLDEEKTEKIHNSFEVGDIISITGKCRFDNYSNSLTISIDEKNGQTIQKSDTFDLVDFLPTTNKDIDKMVLNLKNIIEEIENTDMKILMKSFFDDAIFLEKYSKTPAASIYHHNYVGGLIEHVLNMIELAKVISTQYPNELDLDLLIVGCILHDIGKMKELEMKASITYSVTGSLLGHITIGSHMVQNKIESIENFPENLKNKILHLILSHHGSLEFGSPVEPMIPEAIVLNRIDECDSKTKRVLQLKQEHMSKSKDEIIRIRNFGKMYLK